MKPTEGHFTEEVEAASGEEKRKGEEKEGREGGVCEEEE